MVELNRTGGRPDTDAEAILALAEQSASAVEATPGYHPEREGYAAAALRGFVQAARTLIRERTGRSSTTP